MTPPPRLGLGNGLVVDAAIVGTALLLLGIAFAALGIDTLGGGITRLAASRC